MVRLVKGAYWDSEIKRAQVAGLAGYPVYTTKAATDLSYLVCARALLNAAPALYGQFATHNAHTLAAVRQMARQAGLSPEFQRLHGMGEALYAGANDRYGAFPLRVYAPVGSHEDLLPYLVRRLLENGANTSFVHAPARREDPGLQGGVRSDRGDRGGRRRAAPAHSPAGRPLRAQPREFPAGMDLSIAEVRDGLAATIAALPQLEAGPIVSGKMTPGRRRGAGLAVRRLADRRAGRAGHAGPDRRGLRRGPQGPAGLGRRRRGRPRRCAARHGRRPGSRPRTPDRHLRGGSRQDPGRRRRRGPRGRRLLPVLCEPRRAAVRDARDAQGAGRRGQSTLAARRGVFACISPWNFPLAIFTPARSPRRSPPGNAVVAQARRAEPADRGGRRGSSSTTPACTPTCCTCCPATAPASARPSSPTRPAPAWPSPAAPTPPGRSTARSPPGRGPSCRSSPRPAG